MTATMSERISAWQVLAQALLLSGLASAAAAQGPTMRVEADGAHVELVGSSAQCVNDASGLHCAPLATDGGLPSSQAASNVTSVSGAITILNSTASTQVIIVTLTLPHPPQPKSMIGGSGGGAGIDANSDGSGGLATVSGTALYQALIDGTAVASLLPDPTLVPGPMFPGTFTFSGASANIPPASFGLTAPGQSGPAVMNSIGIRLTFQIAAGDATAFTSVFGMASANAVGAAQTEAPQQVREIRPLLTAVATADACPQHVLQLAAASNLTLMPQTFVVNASLPVSPLAATVVGGSTAGSVTDANFDGTGGIATSGTTPLYQGIVDGTAVAGAVLYSAPFTLPAGGSFTTVGATASLPAASFGLPGPTLAGPPVTAGIGIRETVTLGAGDVFASLGLLVVDCAPTPTETPTATPTATVTETPTSTPTPTPVSQGGGCSDTSQCATGLFCADGVCCNTACDGPLQQCDVPPNVGTCAGIAPAPAASHTALLLALALLAGIAGWTLRRAQRPAR